MIAIQTKEDQYAKWLGDGKVQRIQAEKSVSEDGLVTTVTSKSDEQLTNLGFQKFVTKQEGTIGPGKKISEKWTLEDGVLTKTIIFS